SAGRGKDGEGEGRLFGRAAAAGVEGWVGSSLSSARITETIAARTITAPATRVTARPSRPGRRCRPLPIWAMLSEWASPTRTDPGPGTGSSSKPHPEGVREPPIARGSGRTVASKAYRRVDRLGRLADRRGL